MKKVLIIGQERDPHIDKVRQSLSEKGVNVLTFFRYSENNYSTVKFINHKVEIKQSINGETGNLDDIGVVWWRVKKVIPVEMSDFGATTSQLMRTSEWKAYLYGLSSVLPNAKWVNPISSIDHFSNKVYQHYLANMVGFNTPNTVITNNYEDILPLFNRGRVVYKTVSSFFWKDTIIYTTEISKSEVIKSKDDIALAPGIYQNYIEKKYELRVMVVGQSLCAVKIDSQKHTDTSIDWRKNQGINIYEEISLDSDTQNKIFEFHQQCSLVIGVYDFIVDLDGNVVFLECNPGGQWLWIEYFLPITFTSMFCDYCISSLNQYKQEDNNGNRTIKSFGL